MKTGKKKTFYAWIKNFLCLDKILSSERLFQVLESRGSMETGRKKTFNACKFCRVSGYSSKVDEAWRLEKNYAWIEFCRVSSYSRFWKIGEAWRLKKNLCLDKILSSERLFQVLESRRSKETGKKIFYSKNSVE